MTDLDAVLKVHPEHNMNILHDSLYLKCISLARLSSSDIERYGALLIKDDKIIGAGYNRAIAHKSFKERGIVIDRILRMGYANHAEIEAIDYALQKGIDVKNSELYVAGYFYDTGKLFIKEHPVFTCDKCPKYLREYEVNIINVPLNNRWASLNINNTESISESNNQSIHDYRKSITDGDTTIYNIERSLTPISELKKFIDSTHGTNLKK